MSNANNIGRIGALAVALGIGAGLAATPWAASAEPGNGQGNGQNMSVSTNGEVRVQKGTADRDLGRAGFGGDRQGRG